MLRSVEYRIEETDCMPAKKGDKGATPGATPLGSNTKERKGYPKARSVNDVTFFQQISELLENRGPDKNVLLTIPIWGWTGDGKTCALLTAVHYSDQALHPLVLAPITNPDELAALEASTDEYKGLNLAGTASATSARFHALAETFIDGSEWPPGTDEPSAYILAIRSAKATLGYAVFPDLRGGSFREVDETARGVLNRAHAAVLLIDPERWVDRGTTGKRYRNEVLTQLHGFAAASVPVCVMLTKADQYKGPHPAADRAEEELTILLDQQTALEYLLCRVSVIGIGQKLTEGKPPPAAARHPDDLLKAWVWLVAQGLARPTTELRKLVPPINIRAAGEHFAAAVSMEAVAEFRPVGDFSSSPGTALCSSSDDPRSLLVTFVSAEGELMEAAIATTPGAQAPQFQHVGSVPEWEEGAAFQAQYLGGEYIIGARTKCNFVWQGSKNGALAKLPLPSEMAAWVPVTSRRMVAVDASGRLHSLRLENSKWVQADYLETFIAPSPYLACALIERSSHVLAYNGVSVEGVIVGPDGNFGSRFAPELNATFDSEKTATNRLGLCLGMTKAGHISLSAADAPVAIGEAKPDLPVPHALAPTAPVVAFVEPDLRLSAALVRGDAAVTTETEHSPVLQSAPTNMIWTQGGEMLVVSLDDDTWRVFKPLGLLQ
jgi:hypothetical protein